MKSSEQQTALTLWNTLPHAMVWVGLVVMCVVFGYGETFANLTPALPLMLALVQVFDSPPRSLRFSVLVSGIVYDALAGLPLGFTGIIWLIVYMLLPRAHGALDDDEPFFSRWFLIAGWLLAYVVLEWVGAAIFNIQTSSISSLAIRYGFMVSLMPLAAWLVWQARRRTYRRLWVFLPNEVKPL